MSKETKSLLVSESSPDLNYRDNVIALKWGDAITLEDGTKLTLVRSGHMLGSAQVLVEYQDGYRCGYSGDFAWPIDEVIQVDELVVDSTYGNPSSIRKYSQDEAENRLIEIVSQRLRYGSVHIYAHRGTIERVLHLLSSNVNAPILGTRQRIAEITVYQQNGFGIGNILGIDSKEGRTAIQNQSYIRLYSKGDGYRNELVEGTSISCSAYMNRADNPVVEYSDRAYGIALTNHADFEGSMNYIKSTGAKKVITDNTRCYGVDLAVAVNKSLRGVVAEPSSNIPC